MSRKDEDRIAKARRLHRRIPKLLKYKADATRGQGDVAIGGGANAIPAEGELLRYGYERINDPDTDPRLKLRYWERIGEHLHMWGPRAEKRKPQQPVEFDIEGDAANLP